MRLNRRTASGAIGRASGTKRRLITVLALIWLPAVAGLLPLAVTRAQAEACPGPQDVGSLPFGRDLFWEGSYADTGTGVGNCVYEYALDVGDGDRLRVALDLVLDYRDDGTVHPSASADDGRRFGVEIIDEDGKAVKLGRDCCEGTEAQSDYSAEIFLCFNRAQGSLCEPFEFDEGTPCDLDPATGLPRFTCEEPRAASLTRSSQGTWTLRVTPRTSSGWRFRMRAALEASANPSSPQPASQAEPPNLRAVPPFELTFCEPKVSAGFFIGHTPVCGTESNGVVPQEETDRTASGSHRGLRFSAGPENWPGGLFEVGRCPGTPLGVDEDGDPTAQACQRRYLRSGEPVLPDRPAGTLEFHQAHGHWHYQFFRYELFRVEDPSPKSVPLNKTMISSSDQGSKVGFCPEPERMADWERVGQEIWNGFDGGSCLDPVEPRMRLKAGWGDLYEWARVEQFVEFPNADGSPAAGLYLLRTTVDAESQIEETNENDNTSFVYFEVCSRSECAPQGIRIIERGYGLDP